MINCYLSSRDNYVCRSTHLEFYGYNSRSYVLFDVWYGVLSMV